MNYIDADKLIAEIERLKELHKGLLSGKFRSGYYSAFQQVRSFIKSIQQEQPDMDLEKLVNEEFASHSRTTEYGLVATYNRDELYRLIKRMAIVFSARKEK